MMRYLKPELITDRKGVCYKVVPFKTRTRVIGRTYLLSNGQYVGVFFGDTKDDLMRSARNNIDIMVYD